MSLPMSEAQFQGWMIDVATTFGWRGWHVPTPAKAVGDRLIPSSEGAGLCDWILMHDDPPRMIFAELKRKDGRLSAAQVDFLRMARAAASACPGCAGEQQAPAFGVYVWEDGMQDIIETILRSKVLIDS